MHTIAILCMFAVFLRFLFVITILTGVAIVLASLHRYCLYFCFPAMLTVFARSWMLSCFLLSRVSRASLEKWDCRQAPKSIGLSHFYMITRCFSLASPSSTKRTSYLLLSRRGEKWPHHSLSLSRGRGIIPQLIRLPLGKMMEGTCKPRGWPIPLTQNCIPPKSRDRIVTHFEIYRVIHPSKYGTHPNTAS